MHKINSFHSIPFVFLISQVSTTFSVLCQETIKFNKNVFSCIEYIRIVKIEMQKEEAKEKKKPNDCHRSEQKTICNFR